jgi:hypothetical protein
MAAEVLRENLQRQADACPPMRGTRDQHQQPRVALVQQLTHPASPSLVDCIAGFQETGLKL